MRAIPKTGELLPAVGLGSWQTFDIEPASSERAVLREVLKRFATYGGRLVDTSPMYGSAEEVIGDLAADLELGGKLFLATKVWTTGRKEGIRQMEESFQRLRTDRMDLIQIHNLKDWKTHLKTLREWKDQGRVRYIGITHYTESAYDELAQVMQKAQIDFVQLNYSIVARAAEQHLLPLAQEKGIAVIANQPFAQGSLFARTQKQTLPLWCKDIACESWAQFFLKFVLAHPAITCVIPATSQPAHIADIMKTGDDQLPDGATRQHMLDLIRAL
jgi:diketogulonate reductase-like aldo/keto reductase